MNPLLSVSSLGDRGGQGLLEVEIVFGQSTVTSVYSTSPMKILTPVSRGKSVHACTTSFGGGLVAGDQTRLWLSIGAGAGCYLGTQSSTKIYCNPAQLQCSHVTTAHLGAGALLVFAPDPVQPYAGSRFTQRQEFRLEAGAGLVLLDWFTSGRAARGERWIFDRFESRNDVYVDGESVFVDSILLGTPEDRGHMGRFNCVAMLALMGSGMKGAVDGLLAGMAGRPVNRRGALVSSVSPCRGGALLRVAGQSVELVRQELLPHLAFVAELLGDDPWARKW